MAGFIKSVLVFTLLVTVMKGLINSGSFRAYFKFFSGLVFILVMIGPLLGFLSGGSGWYSLLEQEIFNFNLEGINDELKVADGKFEDIIREECKADIKEQIKKLAENRNINVKYIDIELSDKDSSIQVTSIGIVINRENQDNNVLTDTEEAGGIQNIKDVDIGISNGKKAVDAMSEDGERRKAYGKDIQDLKKDISSYFIIKEAAVNIWE